MSTDSGTEYLHWCDTHCHLDASEFQPELDKVMRRSMAAGVGQWIVPAVSTSAFEVVRAIAHRYAGADYALGIHPLYVKTAKASHIDLLETWLLRHRADKKLLA
ncbi:MAG: TatD family deoxyribonuclease, partial [Betaproteobacteria bacterium]|nr:TatD family deoxyribonuclease [Betaproteobacteria bacterium]